MSATVVRNTREGAAPAEPPRREDGAMFPYAMLFDGGKFVAYGDDLADLLDALRPEYLTLDAAEQLQARIRLAVDAQVAIQAQINASVKPEAWNALSEEERAVLTGPRYEQPRLNFQSPDSPEEGFWDAEVPLVLVDSGYAPYTGIDRPISGIADVENPPNMIWLRPIDEYEFLTSLSDAGFINLMQATDL